MAARVFLLNRLREGAVRDEYERFVREVDYPASRALPGIRGFQVARIEGLLTGEGVAPYDYVEVVDVASMDAYRQLLGGPELRRLTEEWSTHVADSVIVHGEVIAQVMACGEPAPVEEHQP